MKILRRINILYIVSLVTLLFVFIPGGSANAIDRDSQDLVIQDDGYSNEDHNNNSISYKTSDRIVGHNLISGNNVFFSANGSDISLFSLSNVLSLTKSCGIVKNIIHVVSLHSQDFVYSLFHPPKISLA
jgi:hypothetical protein